MVVTLKGVVCWMIIIKLIICPEAGAAVVPSEDYFGSVSLVNNDVYHLFWKSDDTSITFEVHAKVKGWIGFGLSPNGGMASSDIVIGWVKDGVPYFKDRYAEQDGVMPTIDESQDWNLLAAEETSTHTILKFKRPLYLCDPRDRQVTADTMRVIFAYSDRDPTTEDAVLYHESNRGTKSVLLIEAHGKPPPMPADAFYVDFLNNNVTIRDTSDTTYWCHGFHRPNMTGEHHLIKIEPIIQPGNEAFVHHILLYACYHKPAGVEQYDDSQGSICAIPVNMPWKECTVILAAWAVGGTTYHFPKHVGFPYGGIMFHRMVTHFDNAQLTKGVVDSSGLRLWFTKSLRQYDAAVFGAGVNVFTLGQQILPAGYPNLEAHGHCTRGCLDKAMGTVPEIHVFSILLHTHLLGTGIRVRHYRDGVEKSLLGSDLAYDFNFQEIRSISPEITIRKGDNLVVECFYKTSDKKNATFGGFGTSDEMCVAFVYYYPTTNLIYCLSVPTQANVAEHLSLKYEGGKGSSMAKINDGPHRGKTLNQFIQAIGELPNQATMNKFQEAIKTGEFIEMCEMRTNKTFREIQVPKVVVPYQEKVVQCSAAVLNQPPDAMMLISCGLMFMMATKMITTK